MGNFISRLFRKQAVVQDDNDDDDGGFMVTEDLDFGEEIELSFGSVLNFKLEEMTAENQHTQESQQAAGQENQNENTPTPELQQPAEEGQTI